VRRIRQAFKHKGQEEVTHFPAPRAPRNLIFQDAVRLEPGEDRIIGEVADIGA
jgi:hypothetical protein